MRFGGIKVGQDVGVIRSMLEDGSFGEALTTAIRDGSGMLFETENVSELITRLKRSADLPWSEDLVRSWVNGLEYPSDAERRLVAACLDLPGSRLHVEGMNVVPDRRRAALDLMEAAERLDDLRGFIPKSIRKRLFMSGEFPLRLKYAIARRRRMDAKVLLEWSDVFPHVRHLIGVLANEKDEWILTETVPEEPVLTALATTLWVDTEYLSGISWSKHSVLNRT